MFAYLIVNLSGCLNMKKGQMCLVGRILIYYGLAVGLAGLFWIVKEVFFQLVIIKGFLIKFEVANYVYQYSWNFQSYLIFQSHTKLNMEDGTPQKSHKPRKANFPSNTTKLLSSFNVPINQIVSLKNFQLLNHSPNSFFYKHFKICNFSSAIRTLQGTLPLTIFFYSFLTSKTLSK